MRTGDNAGLLVLFTTVLLMQIECGFRKANYYVFSHDNFEIMIKSMTGFGKAAGVVNSLNTSVELRSLNSKSMDISLRMPSSYKTFEIGIRSMISDKLVRGKVELNIAKDEGLGNKATINKSLITEYYSDLVDLEKETGTEISDKLTLIMGFPDVLVTEKKEADKKEWEDLQKLISSALEAIDTYRINEGENLKTDLLHNINNIESLKEEIKPYAEGRMVKIKERIRKNLKTNLEEVSYDENRFEQELIYYLEKIDVNEELVRLQGNIDYFKESIEKEKSEGKKLRFISQELGREINTLGAKSYDADMQKVVVNMKDELEKIKEQLLNVL